MRNGGGKEEKWSFPVRAYLEFCDIYSLNPIEQTTANLYVQISRYTVWRLKFLDGTCGTIKDDICKIQNWLALQGVHSDILNQYRPMQRILKAAEKLNPKKHQTKRPFQWWEIQKIFELIPTNNINSIVLRAAISFALATAMRPDEFLAHKVRDDSEKRKDKYLKYGRILIWQPTNKSERNHFGVVWFFSSKTNQTGLREFATLPCGCDKGLCPIIELRRLLSILSKPTPETAIFTWENGNFVTTQDFRKKIKGLADQIGSNADEIGSYSLKKTAITQAILDGMPDSVVVQLARWRSFSSIRPYINLGPRQLLEARERINGSNDNRNRMRQLMNDKFKH